MKKNKKSIIKRKNIIVDGWSYIRESKNSILFATAIFLFFIFAALVLPVPSLLEEMIKNSINQIMERTIGLNTSGIIFYVFFNNLEVSLVGMFFGIFIGIIPFMLLAVNGYVIGYVSRIVMYEKGVFYLWRLVPHGIFELPAVIISLGLGMRLGLSAFSKNPGKEFVRRALLSLKALLIMVILLFIAALIEGSLISIFS